MTVGNSWEKDTAYMNNSGTCLSAIKRAGMVQTVVKYLC